MDDSPKYMNASSTARHLQSLWLLLLLAPLSLASCRQSMALSPLIDACRGTGVRDAAAYDPKATPKPVIAGFVFDQEVQQADNRFVSGQLVRANSVQEAQLVVCVEFLPRKELETCRYTGTEAVAVPRTERTANVTLVAAKTGQVLERERITATIDRCPTAISGAPSDSSWNIHQDTVHDNLFNADFDLRDRVANWSFSATRKATDPKRSKS